jgi:hypothetical protein
MLSIRAMTLTVVSTSQWMVFQARSEVHSSQVHDWSIAGYLGMRRRLSARQHVHGRGDDDGRALQLVAHVLCEAQHIAVANLIGKHPPADLRHQHPVDDVHAVREARLELVGARLDWLQAAHLQWSIASMVSKVRRMPSSQSSAPYGSTDQGLLPSERECDAPVGCSHCTGGRCSACCGDAERMLGCRQHDWRATCLPVTQKRLLNVFSCIALVGCPMSRVTLDVDCV